MAIVPAVIITYRQIPYCRSDGETV